MDRLLISIVIAVTALTLNDPQGGTAMAREIAVRAPAAGAAAPVGAGLGSGTVLSLVIALEALRTAPLPAGPGGGGQQKV